MRFLLFRINLYTRLKNIINSRVGKLIGEYYERGLLARAKEKQKEKQSE